jgi:hypothetical protein
MASLSNVLASSSVFVGFSISALVATLAVGIGLYLEYERYEDRLKRIGNLLVVGGVILEALFGLVAFTSATIRESRSELQIAMLTVRANQLAKDAETARSEIASANERAAKAQRKAVDDEIALLQLQEKLAWRHIDSIEEGIFADSAEALVGHTIILSANSLDPEAKEFAGDIDVALTFAHAKVKHIFSPDKGKLSPGLNCLATKGTASERDVLIIAHAFRVITGGFACGITWRAPNVLGPAEINVGAKPEL